MPMEDHFLCGRLIRSCLLCMVAEKAAEKAAEKGAAEKAAAEKVVADAADKEAAAVMEKAAAEFERQFARARAAQ